MTSLPRFNLLLALFWTLFATIMSTANDVNWRQKCIDEFKLLSIPAEWKVDEKTSTATNDVWRAYFHHRKQCESRAKTLYAGQDSDGYDYYLEKDLVKQCRNKLKQMQEAIGGAASTWLDITYVQVTELVPEYDGIGDISTAEYKAIVWSMYAIPHSVELEHRYHCRPRYSSVEFSTSWYYTLKYYTDVVSTFREDKRKLCSNCFEDERLRLDCIDARGLDSYTVSCLRLHLFGANSDESKQALNDFDFLRLLFASMATPDFETLKGNVGYAWQPGLGSRAEKELVDEGLVANIRDAMTIKIKWLEYEVRRVTDTLRPIDKYYEPPRLQDALGYDSEEMEDY